MTSGLLGQAWGALGGDPVHLGLVEVIGSGSGLLPSAHAALPAMTAAVAVSTLAASILDSVRRDGPAVPVFIDREHVAVSSRSEHYARSDTFENEDRISPLSPFWMTADGLWFRVHGEYPWHRKRALEVLACEDGHRSVKKSVRGWRAEDLENALAAAGGLGYAVLSAEQWSAHPQGRAVATLPLLQTTVGAGEARASGAGRRGACGIRVLDLTRVLAGPIATRTLAAWGADVLRLDGPRLPELPTHALDTMSGKRSAELDLADRAGLERLEHLLERADLVVNGYRPGALARFGLDLEALWERHPHLNVVTLSAWGSVGPWSGRRGFDSLVQCSSGIALSEGSDGRPGWLPAQVLDHATGYLAAAASFLALASARRDGRPRSVRLSLAQTARWLTGAGSFVAEEPRRVDVGTYRVALPGARAPVEVIAPPGRLADLSPRWMFTTDPCSDPPRFATEE